MTPPVRSLMIASSLVAIATTTSGCLDDPPEYEAPARVPPVVADALVEPDPSRVIQLDAGVDVLSVSVPFRSEDLGSSVVGFFFLDGEPGDGDRRLGDEVTVGPSSFEDEGRSISALLTGFAQLQRGCYSLTLLLTQRSNIEDFSVDPREDSEATRVRWWLLLASEDEDRAVLLADCPILALE